MPIPAKISELIERFEEHGDDYRAGKYNETQLRRDFLDPFFGLECLGWDMDNTNKAGENVREVVQEYPLKIEGANKKPDYCFRNGHSEKFFVEAKKPSVNLKDDLRAAFQTRSYGWNKGLPFCVLTDFEEFAVYDCRYKPVNTDSAQTARTFYCKYTEYDAKWSEIEALFGREAVRNGSLDKKAAQKVKKGTVTFDADFLHLIEGWREGLAQNIAQRNKNISSADLNYAVQMTIDRILFLRICEDRDIEPYQQLQKISAQKGIYGELGDLFKQADNRYNSGLFHFGKEKARSGEGDGLTLNLKIDDSVLHSIIYKLYPPQPYNFRLVPVEILGQVYEQFLGKVIRLEKSSAIVEDKPEVRKAGGVFYTPSYIVDYIVRQTLGPLCAGKTPKEIADLKVLDPACGSGSFLIGAYDFLLNWHLDYYTQNAPEKLAARREAPICRETKDQVEGAAPLWRLTVKEKKRILLNNIFGVDIDRQAVEVTKLSLLLKVLEDGTPDNAPTTQSRLVPSQDRLLPDLDANIKCGNSLIGFDFYEAKGFDAYAPEEQNRINAFDWQSEFEGILKNGGFDAIIGNPPYIRIQALQEWAPLEVEHLKKQYASAGVGNYDIYVVFVERALQLLNKRGTLGYILPHKFFNAKYGAPLRELIAEGAHLSDVVHFGHQQVFANATTYTCLLFLTKGANAAAAIAKVDDLESWYVAGESVKGNVPAETISAAEWNFAIGKDAALFEKLAQMPVKLGDVAERMAQGIRTSANEIYVLDLVEEKGSLIKAHSKQLNKEVTLERDSVALFLQGREIKPYRVIPSGKVVIMPYCIDSRHAKLLPEQELKAKFPQTFSYLEANKDYLEKREKGRFRGSDWYIYGRPQNIDLMLLSKILVPDIADRASFAYDENGDYAFTSGYGITLKDDVKLSPKYVLGLLNSNVLNFYLRNVSTTLRGGFFRYFTQFIEQLPIRAIDFADKDDKARHDEMVKLVQRMLDLQQKLAAARTAPESTALQRQISATDRQIDKLVYALYGLTDDEIALVEGA